MITEEEYVIFSELGFDVSADGIAKKTFGKAELEINILKFNDPQSRGRSITVGGCDFLDIPKGEYPDIDKAVKQLLNAAAKKPSAGNDDQKDTPAPDEATQADEQKNVPDQSIETTSTPKKSELLDLIRSYVGNDVLEVFGDTGSGKSKFGLEVARQAIAMGKNVFYLDTERNLTEKDIKSLKGCQYRYTPIIEEIDRIVMRELPKVDVVILDSIGFPVLTSYARLNMKQKGDALLKLIAIFGDLKAWAYRNNGMAIVMNQPESEFNKEPGHILRPFGDKSQFAAKEIWKTEITQRNQSLTKINISAFRSRNVGYGTKMADMAITSNGVEIKRVA